MAVDHTDIYKKNKTTFMLWNFGKKYKPVQNLQLILPFAIKQTNI